MTHSDPQMPPSDAPNPASVKEAFARCFSIEDSQQQSETLDQLERENPAIGAEVRLLLGSLRTSEKVERVSAYVPVLDLSQENVSDRLEDLSDEFAVDRLNPSVLRAMEKTFSTVPQVVLKSSAEEERVVKVRSSEIDQTTNKQDGRYRLDGEIARGGMGAILKGRDTDLGRDLAIKVLLKEHHNNPETAKRFIEEAQIGGQLQHPGIAPVYELGQFQDGRPFFTMKLIKGKTLSALLAERKSVEDDRAKYLGIFEQICQTMAYAHSHGVLHRDLKPSNVMVGAFGEVQTMDWGLAKVLAAGGVADERKPQVELQDQSIIQTVRSVELEGTYPEDDSATGSATRMGSIMGTPAYMSPEQACGEVNLHNLPADVFSLGSILCEILTGHPVYRSGMHVNKMTLARQGDTRDALQRLDESTADRELVQLTKDCLAVDPGQRPRDAQAICERLSDYLESVDERLRETELEVVRTRAKAEAERNRFKVVSVLVTSIVMTAAIGWWWVQQKEAELATIKTDSQTAAAAEQLELEQQVQRELTAAAVLADDLEQTPSERDLARAMESLQRAKSDLSSGMMPAAITERLEELIAQVSRQQADLRLIRRLEEIWQIEQQYFAEKDLPPIGNVQLGDGPNPVRKGDDAGIPTDISNPAGLYKEAFEQWGFHLHETPQNDFVERVQKIAPNFRASIIASVDRWRQTLDAEYSLVDWHKKSWKYLNPIKGQPSDGFSVLPDQSILVGGIDDYPIHEFVFETEATEISALRLEALFDESLPNNGPGQGPQGQFDLKILQVGVAPLNDPKNFKTVVLNSGVASHSDVTWPFQVSLWRTLRGGGERPFAAFYQLAETISCQDGFRIVVVTDGVRDHELVSGRLGRFRWSATQLDDQSAEKASLESLLASLDTDPWRKQLRKALLTTDTSKLMELATNVNAVEKQPNVLLTQLSNHLNSYTGAELEAFSLADVEYQIVHPTEVKSEEGTKYTVVKDGVIEAGGALPDSEVTTIVLPPGAIQPTTRLIRIELMRDIEDVPTSYIGRRKFLRFREITFSQASERGPRNVVSRVFADFPFHVSLNPLVDGDVNSTLSVPFPDQPRTFYFVLNHDSLEPQQSLEIKLHTGSDVQLRNSNPSRFRISVASHAEGIRDPFLAAEQLLMHLVTERSSDPLVHLQLARYYSLSTPVRTVDALRHVSIASSLLNESIVPSLAFVDIVEPSHLLNNAPLRQLAIKHVRRVEYRQDFRNHRLRSAIEAAVIENYSQGKTAEAEQLLELALVSFNEPFEFFVQLLQREPWKNVPVNSWQESLFSCLERNFPDTNDPMHLRYFHAIGTLFSRFRKVDEALKFTEKTILIAPNDSLAHHNRGIALLNLGRFDEAAEEFEIAIEIDPTHSRSHFSLGKAYYKLNKLEEAFEAFQESVQVDTENQSELFFGVGKWLASARSLYPEDFKTAETGEGETFTQSGNPISIKDAERSVEEGIRYLKLAIEMEPKNRRFHSILGAAYLRNQAWQQAVDQLELLEALAATEYDRDRSFFFQLSMAHWRLGHQDKAREYFARGSVWLQCRQLGHRFRDQSDAASLLELGPKQQSQLLNDGYELWLQEMAEVFDEESPHFREWQYLGFVHGRMGRHEAAIDAFSKAIELNPRDTDSRAMRSYAYRSLGQHDLALKDRNRNVDLEPLDSERYFERAEDRRSMGDYELAIEDIERGIQVNPLRQVSWFSHARARSLAGDIYLLNLVMYEKAVEQYDKALEYDADYFYAWRGRAHAHWQLKNYEQGIADIDRAIELRPEDSVSYGIRSKIHLELGQLDQSILDLTRAIDANPTRNLSFFQRARIYQLQGEFDLALADIKKGFEVDPKRDALIFPRASAYKLAGDIYLDDLKQSDKALEQYNKAVELAPENTEYQSKRDQAARDGM